jgi:hypothetical protein
MADELHLDECGWQQPVGYRTTLDRIYDLLHPWLLFSDVAGYD